MSKKLDGFAQQPLTEQQKADALEDAPPELRPEPGTVVPTGEESAPVASPSPTEARKALYEKSRRNRELVTREDAAGAPDVALVEAMVAEASGGQKPVKAILDTNRRGRDDPPIDEKAEERRALAELMAKGQAEARSAKPEVEDGNPKPEVLTEPELPATMVVKVLGKEYEVPRQDIDDAGGIEAYQKSRAATIRLQRAAQLERQAIERAKQAQQALEVPAIQQETDPSPDGLGEADIGSLRNELLDVVVDGSQADIDKWIESKLKQARSAKTPTPKPSTPRPTVSDDAYRTASETQKELEAQYEADRQEANQMMTSQYKDIMHDPDLLEIAQQRFRVLASDPRSEGRTQKEMAREAAEFVRSLGKRQIGDRPRQTDPAEAERQQRITRKRKLPQPSQADAAMPAAPPQEKQVPSRREHFMRLRKAAGHDLND